MNAAILISVASVAIAFASLVVNFVLNRPVQPSSTASPAARLRQRIKDMGPQGTLRTARR